jgi:hypothetical protein
MRATRSHRVVVWIGLAMLVGGVALFVASSCVHFPRGPSTPCAVESE